MQSEAGKKSSQRLRFWSNVLGGVLMANAV
jgi:hypothetical protein